MEKLPDIDNDFLDTALTAQATGQTAELGHTKLKNVWASGDIANGERWLMEWRGNIYKSCVWYQVNIQNMYLKNTN